VNGSSSRRAAATGPDAPIPALPEGIRPMTAEDLDAVFDIEIRAYAFPWTRGIFRECFRVGYPAWVVERDDRIVGYGILSAAAGEAHILNLCVDPDYQRRGIGRCLLHWLIVVSGRLGAERLILEVRQSNQRAASIYRAAGFEPIGRRKAYYRGHDGKEDAIVFALALDGGEKGDQPAP